MSDKTLPELVNDMEKAIIRLYQYAEHTCMMGRTDSPDGDVCTCRVSDAISNALAKCRALRDYSEGKKSEQ